MTQLPNDGGDLTDVGVIALRLALAAAGFSPLPEYTASKFGPGDWRERDYDPAVSHVGKHGVLLNTGLRLRDTWAIDIDVDQPSDVAGILDLARTILGQSPCVRHRSNSARRALLFRGEGLFRAAKGSDGAIEVFSGERSKLTAFGLHQDKTTQVRTRIQWQGVPGNVRHADLPVVSAEQIDAFLHAAGDWLGEDTVLRIRQPHEPQTGKPKVADKLDDLIDAMAYVDNTGPMEWHEWNRVGMALFAGSDGDARALRAFCVWTAQNPHTRHRDCIKRWEAYGGSPPTSVGAGSIFHAAFANGFRPVQTPDEAARKMIAWKKAKTEKRMAQNWKPLI